MHYNDVIFFNDEWQGMKITSTIFDAINAGKNMITSNIQFINPIKILNTERFQTTTDASDTPTSNLLSKATDVSGNLASIKGFFTKSSTPEKVAVDASGIPLKVQVTKPKPTPMWVKIVKGIGIFIFVCMVLLMSSLVSNHLIMQPVSIRVIAFILTFIMTLINPVIFILVLGYYIFFAITRFYYNTLLPEGQKKSLLPYQFCLLPITTYKANTTAEYILMYPFSYALPELQVKLTKEKNNVLESIENSFPNFAVMSGLEGFTGLYKKFQEHLNDLHEYKVKDEQGVDKVMKPFQYVESVTLGAPRSAPAPVPLPSAPAPLPSAPAPLPSAPAPQAQVSAPPVKSAPIVSILPAVEEQSITETTTKINENNKLKEKPVKDKYYIVNRGDKQTISKYLGRFTEGRGEGARYVDSFVSENGKNSFNMWLPDNLNEQNKVKYQPIEKLN